MIVLIRAAKVVDPNSKYNNKVVDILIEKGIIQDIGKNLTVPKDADIIEEKGLHVSPGLFDLHVNFGDPGFEWKEDMQTGMLAAAKGGFTGVLCMPSTLPVIDTKSQVEYIQKMSTGNVVNVHPAGSITKNLKGQELTEMFDMNRSGALAFTDDKNSIQHAGVMKLALLYAKNFGGIIMNQANDKSISKDGQMNEGVTSTLLGLKGIPSLAEDLMIARDIKLAEYTEGRLHFSCISTSSSVELIRAAKKQGLKITADVAIHNLVLDETVCKGFDTRNKVNPALRTQKDIKALLKGLKDGTIDAICTDHTPQDIEHKKIEFDNAEFGMIGLQTAFSLACQLEQEIGLEGIIDKMAIKPRKILGIEVPEVNIEKAANLCLFNPSTEWTLEEKDIVSKSKNTPFVGKTLKGKIVGVVNNGILS
ncbi:MAG: dihydroorotase [Flavobacteriales bacterium]|nr:dihydroorotase [Flavobacteriales bacterium]